MPVYEYLCARCGPFADSRPMAEYQCANPCPACGDDAERAILTAPRLGLMLAGRRAARQINERNAHDPAVSSRSDRVHRAGPERSSRANKNKSAETMMARPVKAFPAKRPWMIGH